MLRAATLAMCACACALTLACCGGKQPAKPAKPVASLPIAFTLTYKSASASIGIWMWREDHIANWLDRKYPDAATDRCGDVAAEESGDVGLFEPIDVVWLDFVSKDATAARAAIEAQLLANHFTLEDNVVGVLTQHSDGYYTFIGSPQQRVDQSPDDKTWVSSTFPDPNNHARVFSAVPVVTNGRTVFVSTASLSREAGGFPAIPWHAFISFSCAQDAVAATGDWRLVASHQDIGTTFPPATPGTGPKGERFHTADNGGATVFVREHDDSGLVGQWCATHIEGAADPYESPSDPCAVSTWHLNPDGTYTWWLHAPPYYTFDGSGTYAVSGSTLSVTGIIKETLFSASVGTTVAIPLTMPASDTFNFADEDGDHWTFKKQ